MDESADEGLYYKKEETLSSQPGSPQSSHSSTVKDPTTANTTTRYDIFNLVLFSLIFLLKRWWLVSGGREVNRTISIISLFHRIRHRQRLQSNLSTKRFLYRGEFRKLSEFEELINKRIINLKNCIFFKVENSRREDCEIRRYR